jgi:AraC family transcriptional regulator
MTIKANAEYTKRIDRVIDHIRDHIDESLKLEDLAGVACFSDFHFHRIFHAITGETLNNFTNRLRLEKAARLLTHSDQSATQIALDCGFSSSAVFSRSFAKTYGTTPSAYRNNGKVKNSKICKELFDESEYILPMTRSEKQKAFAVTIKKFPEWNVGYIRVTNAFEGNRVLNALSHVVEWAKLQNLLKDGTLFGMSIDDHSVTPKHLYRYEACFAPKGPFECPEGISRMKIPARLYATARIDGDIKMVATAWDYLFADWLINSEFEPEHAPAFEIFLNKEKATDWSNFELELCIPVKKLATSNKGKK